MPTERQHQHHSTVEPAIIFHLYPCISPALSLQTTATEKKTARHALYRVNKLQSHLAVAEDRRSLTDAFSAI